MRLNDRWRERAFILLLYLPVVLFNGAQLLMPVGNTDVIATGFVQYDQPYYMANARQYVDGATNGLLYSSPFSALQDPPPIYFQPQTFVLGWLWKCTGADPGLLFLLFGTVFGLLCVRACLKVLRVVLKADRADFQRIALLFVWGGGLFFIAGLSYGLVNGEDTGVAFNNAFRFDPAGGWWFLNLGRNLVYPFEAYYHFLFFTIVLSVLRGHWVTAALIAAMLAMSHPFTGVATLLMLLVWLVVERWWAHSGRVPIWLPLVIAVELVLALVYYGPVLNSDPEHAALVQQWKIAWTEEGVTTLAAYTIVGALAFLALRRRSLLRDFLHAPQGRLLAIWAFVWSALENHELFMEPVQPLHFTRGYTWSALFLIGAPWLARAITPSRGSSKPLLIALMLVMLLDNGVWMTLRARDNMNGMNESVTMTRDEEAVLTWLNEELPPGQLIVAENSMTAYLALVYTHHRAYYSHKYNTPNAAQRAGVLANYFNGHITDPVLEQDVIVVAVEGERPFVFAERGERQFSSGDLAVYRMAAAR